jgi:hypothetical protein
MAENDARLQVLNTLLTTPHRDLDALWPLHADMVKGLPGLTILRATAPD